MTPRIEVTVRGHDRSIQVEAILDTGFGGQFGLPMDVATWIGAQIAGWRDLGLADGRIQKVPSVYCEVELLGVVRKVRAIVTDLAYPLVGTELLENCRLIVDFGSGAVQLKRKRS
jgi:predicted aspartyl protease